MDPLRELVLPRLDGLKKSGSGFMARCPAHDDREASLSVSEGRDHPVMIYCQTKVCTLDDILAAIGLTKADICAPRARMTSSDDWIACGITDNGYDRRHRKVAEYEYRDASGALVFAVARCALKSNGCQGFRQWRPDPTSKSGKKWSRKLPDGTKVGEGLIYRLPEVLASQQVATPRTVWCVEGEKDADRLWGIGQPATCCAEGAGKWTDAHAKWLAGADVIVCADRDKPGYAHAESVVNSLMSIARSIELVRAAPDRAKDISDHLDAGLHIGRVVTIAQPKLTPPIDQCRVCGERLDPVILIEDHVTHPNCDQDGQ